MGNSFGGLPCYGKPMVNQALLRETNGSYTLNIFVSAIFWVTVTVFMSGGSVFVRLTIVTTYSHCNGCHSRAHVSISSARYSYFRYCLCSRRIFRSLVWSEARILIFREVKLWWIFTRESWGGVKDAPGIEETNPMGSFKLLERNDVI